MKRDENSEPLKAVIGRLLKAYGHEEKYLERQVEAEWKNMLGEVIARKTTSIFLKEGILTVSLQSSIIRDELSFAREKLIKDLNTKLGQELITEIRLK